MPWTYGYDLHDLEQDIADGKVAEPFVRCEALYSSALPISGALIDAFHVDDIQNDPQRRIVATGTATVEDMKTGDVDDALTIAVTFEGQRHTRPSTVSVTLTDRGGNVSIWTSSTQESTG